MTLSVRARLFRSLSLITVGMACALPSAPAQVIGKVFASDASVKGAIVLAGSGTELMSGSSVAAGLRSAELRLVRGGDVRVCPKTQVSVSASPSGNELMLGMGTGAVELHYDIAARADTLVTPDFRIMLPGPGSFDLAVSADEHGNTCVHARGGSTASVVVAESLGDATYQVRPNQQVWFFGGKIAGAMTDMPDECGCPRAPATIRAENRPASPAPTATLLPPLPATEIPKPVAQATPLQPAPQLPEQEKKEAGGTLLAALAAAPAEPSPMQPLPASKPGETHVQVDAPFVFSADAPAPPTTASLRLTNEPMLALLQPQVAPPPPPTSAPEMKTAPRKQVPKRGVFGRLRAAFASIFRTK
jgi:hypothetical protein